MNIGKREELKLRTRAVNAACAAGRVVILRKGTALVVAFDPRVGAHFTPAAGQQTARTVGRVVSSAAAARGVVERFELLLANRRPRPRHLRGRDPVTGAFGPPGPSSDQLLDYAIELQRAAMHVATRRARGRRRR